VPNANDLQDADHAPPLMDEPFPGVDDATLVIRAQEGDDHAFEALLRRHQRPLFALAVRLLGNRADAEDAVQESFLAAWRRLPDFRGDAAFSSWMYRIVTNRCLTLGQRRRPTVALEDAPGDTVAAPGVDSPEQATLATGRLDALHRALDDLPIELRAAWVLRNVEDLGYPEIAEILSCSPDAVRGRIYRARRTLAEVMTPWR